MTSDTSREAQNTSSSGATVGSLRSEKLLDLGKQLAIELGIDDSSDILGRWMAHYVAELIGAADTASAEARPAIFAKCNNAILDLWKHRYHLPNGKRPFESMEPILRALESLDPENDVPRYYSPLRRKAREAQNETEVKNWLSLVEEIDYSARILICYCLSQAAKTAVDKTKEWVRLAKSADLDEIDVPIIEAIIRESTLVERPEESLRKVLQDRLNRLEAFRGMAEKLAIQFREHLTALDPQTESRRGRRRRDRGGNRNRAGVKKS
jgi:hypothetical protein